MDFMMRISLYSDKYNDLSLREKVIALFAATSFVFFLLYIFLLKPIESDVERINAKQSALSDVLLSKQAASNQSFFPEGYEEDLSNKISLLKKNIDHVNSQIANSQKKAIDINDLSLLLKDVLVSNDSLSLEVLKVYPAEKISFESSVEKNDSAFLKSIIYLKFKGDYFSVINYLKLIEGLSWTFFWQDIEYKVEKHPIATVKINLYTLSITEDS